MRLRNKPWTDDFLEQNKNHLVDWDQKNKIDLHSIFNNSNPVYLEIGCGKGNFITNHALNNLKINYLGMEKEKTVVGVALKKSFALFEQNNKQMKNLKYVNRFAENLTLMFEPNSIDKIYLNFSDPWPKARHYKKRLTYIDFLDIYQSILKPNGIIELKTDNDNLYLFSLEQIGQRPNWVILNQTTDLYDNPEMLENNIPTEYESKFNSMGKNINKIVFQNKK